MPFSEEDRLGSAWAALFPTGDRSSPSLCCLIVGGGGSLLRGVLAEPA
jgi:hypothetical protein